jgi:hypothetical protein
MNIKPIETHYKGYRFRSRLEARWAVFFDALGIVWEYEPEGFELSGKVRYLPDFFLAESGIYIEIKPEGNIPFAANRKIQQFKSAVGDRNFYVLQGPPVTFEDDDRETRFDSHLRQLIFCSVVGGAAEDNMRWSIHDLRQASVYARSARFEHGEQPR